MKRKLSRFSKTTVSLVLSFLMIVATVMVTPVGREKAEANVSVFAGNNVISANTSVETNPIESEEGIDSQIDNQGESKETASENTNTEDVKNTVNTKTIPYSSGDASTTVYFINDLDWSFVYLNVWGGTNGAPTYPGLLMTCIDSDLKLYSVDLANNSTGIDYSGSTNAQFVKGTDNLNGYDNNNTGRLRVNTLACGVVYHRTADAGTQCTINPGSASGHFLYSDYSSTNTIYYKASSSVTAYAHYWNSSKSTWWYGVKMTEVDPTNHVYSIKVPSSATNIIFTNNGSSSSDDLSINLGTGNEYDASTSSWTTYSSTPVSTTRTVYFYNKYGWDSPFYVAQAGGSWPGTQMTADTTTDPSGKLFKADIPNSWTGIIFNSKGVNQTITINDISDDAVYMPNEETTFTSCTKYTTTTYSAYTTVSREEGIYRIYFRNNDNWGKTSVYAYYYANEGLEGKTHKSPGWTGEHMTQVPGYDDLFYILLKPSDVSNNDTYHKNPFGIIFNNGKSQTVDIAFNYGNNKNQVWVPDGNKSSEKYTGNWANLASDPFAVVTPVDNSTVTIYAKTGTVRDGSVEGTIDSGSYDTPGTYDKYSRLADITTFEYADTDADHKTITTTDERPYSTPASGVRVKKATVGRNRTIKISVTIKDGFRSKYYVKGFDVNGYTFGAIEQSEAENHKSSGTYTLTYTTSKYDDSNLEITPIYYYFINDKDQYLYNDSSNFITFSAEDFYGPVKDAWLGSIACFAYYTGIGSGNAQYTHFSRQITGSEVNDPVGYASLGGFPGQPMVYDGASYYMQLPKNLYAADGKTKIASIEGITMNNYIWDLVHSENIKGKTSDQAREGANYQTYDYDDFNALMERGATDIIFSFKYRNYLRGNQSPAANDGNRPFYKNGSEETEIMNPMDSAFVKTTIPSRNGWDVLVDYYDYPVDLFANRLENIDQDDIYIKKGDGEDNRDKVLIVSDGYVNYYKTINGNPEEYLGRYGTKWYVYKQDDSGNDFNYIGSMPPSAFLSDCIKDTYPGISTRPLTADDIDNDKFLSFAKSSFNSSLGNDSNFALLKTQYVTLYNSVVGMPAMITYESAITASKGLNYQFNEDGAGNNANRCDGRWYYSIPNSPIRANIIIQVVDDYGNIVELEDPTSESTPKGTKNRDTFNDGTHTGYNTNANAFFTNTTADVNGNSLKGQTDVTVIQNKDNRFSFSADPFSVTGQGTMYEFVGWYLNTGSDLYPPINYGVNANYVLGTRPMNSFATFVARYKEVEQAVSPASAADRRLKITHDLYYNSNSTDPIPHNGDGTPYVKVEILNQSDSVIKTYNDVYGGILVNGESGDDWLKDDYKVKVTLTTVTSTTDTYLHDIYRAKVGEETSDYYRCGKSSGHNTGSTVTTDTVGTISELTSDTTTAPNTYSISYTYPVTTLFQGENNYGIVSRDFFTDLYTQGNIKVNFKYYDRDTTQHSKPTSISEGATTVTVMANPTITKNGNTTTSLENAVSNAVYGEYSTITVDGEEKSLNATVMSHLDNVVDNYYFWTNQDDAVDGIQLISCYRDTGIEMEYDLDAEGTPVYDAQDNTKLLYKTDAQGNPIMKIKLDQNGNRVYKSYKDVLGATVDYSYHTDAFGRLKGESVNSSTIGSAYGDSDKWVTYTMMGDSNVHTLTKNLTNVDLSLVDSITVWVYNAPKKYNVKVYTPTFDGNNAIQQTTTTGTNANVKTETINGTALTYYIPEDPVQKWAFYNQRLGDNDTYGPTSAAGSNNSIDYLTTYGITEAYAGGDIIAPDVTNMDFDGWYALKDSTGNSIDLDYKITSDKSFGYRVSSNLAIIACYVPKSGEETTINNIPGVSVSNAGVDYYVDQSGETGTLKVRENTLLNVYYPGDFVDEDQGIKRYCAIIVKLPVVDTSGNAIEWKTADLETMQPGLRAAIQDKLDNDIGDSGHYRENGSYDITKLSLTVEVNKKAGINCFTYDVKWDSEDSATSNQITLTNKNRVMFTFPMKASLYEGGSNAALLSYAAIYYDLTDETNTDAHPYTYDESTVNAKWILSDNYVPFIYGYE